MLETVMELEREVFLAEEGGTKNGYCERGLVPFVLAHNLGLLAQETLGNLG
ncbi:hypothetical protein GCM10007092_03000 [Thermus composti]|nr:hypothetical protein GCM10007092_03000 [Thermus composti]